MEQVTAIFFSCRRLGLLKRTVDAFMKWNTYPLFEVLIVNDSADPVIHGQLKENFPYKLILNEKNVGLIQSCDLGYAHIKTEYFFHCEDDWMITKGRFIEKSLAIMQERKDIEEVWIKNYPNHPTEEEILETGGVKYKLAKRDHYKGKEGFIYGWHGFTTACSLKRISDYKRVAPYSKILANYKGAQTIWHREHAVGWEYAKLGYRTAVLLEDHAENIGIGQSEYKTGWEK